MRFLSPGAVTSSILENCARLRADFLRRKWLLPPLVRKILPVLVIRKRLAAALYVFNLYFMIIPHQKAPVGLSVCVNSLRFNVKH